METSAETYKRLKKALDNDPGHRYHIRMMLHERSLHIFGGNFADLVRILNFIEDPNNITKVWAEDKRQDQIFFHREVVRYFHNFLSGARSVVEHTRIFMNDAHGNQPIHARYTQKVTEQFANDAMARFVQDLRNYFLHKGVPASTMQLSLNMESGALPVSDVRLKASELRKWTKWSKNGKEYLNGCQDEFPLREVVEAYQEKIVDFYAWFRRELDELHSEELATYEALRKDIEDFENSAF